MDYQDCRDGILLLDTWEFRKMLGYQCNIYIWEYRNLAQHLGHQVSRDDVTALARQCVKRHASLQVLAPIFHSSRQTLVEEMKLRSDEQLCMKWASNHPFRDFLPARLMVMIDSCVCLRFHLPCA